MYGYIGNGYGYNPFGGIFLFIILIFIVCGIVALVRAPRHWNMSHRRWGGGRDALDILKERYAKGEINKEEYEEKKAVLLKE